jgi:hypothetical protein
MGKRVRRDLVGRVFGRWTVLKFSHEDRHHNQYWLSRCACGVERAVFENGLIAGGSRSCGCLHRELTRRRFTTHGHSPSGRPSPEYTSWQAMLARCGNPKNPEFHNYGGRGIAVCERWLVFENFLADMGPRPSGTTIDRWPNLNGNYEPSNCQWSTPKEQAAHQRWNGNAKGVVVLGRPFRSSAAAIRAHGVHEASASEGVCAFVGKR